MTVTDEMVRAARRKAPKFWRDYADSEEQMRQVLTAALAAMWRDIKDAPKDGSSILATWSASWPDNPHIEAVYFSDGTWFYCHDSEATDREPTHFMPLPAPPATEVEIQKRPQKEGSR